MEMIATRDAYGKAVTALGEKYENIVVIDADLSKSTKTAIFKDKFPHRHFNVGIAEANLAGFSAGLSTAGLIPFMSTFAIFATGRCWDQVRNTICYSDLNVKIAATHAGISVGPDGASHQSIEDIAVMRVIPRMNVWVPADGVEVERCCEQAVKLHGPVYIRLGRSKSPVFLDDSYEFVPGKGVVLRDGGDCTVIACGNMVYESIKAADILKEKNISLRVVNMASIKPIDSELIVKCAKETGCIVTAEEHSIIGGLGSAVAEVLCENFPVPMKRVGMNDTFGESGEPDELFKKYGLTAEHIAEHVLNIIDKKEK